MVVNNQYYLYFVAQHAVPSSFNGLLQFLLKQFMIRKFCKIFSYPNVTFVEMHQFYMLLIFTST